MNRAQKRTWLSLLISLAGISLGVVAMLNTANAGHRPTFSLLGLTLTIPLISMVILSWRISGKEYDERDKKIERRAVIFGTLGVFAYLGGACMLLCVINPMSSIKVGHIIISVYLAAFVWSFISSVVALILYGQVNKGGKL